MLCKRLFLCGAVKKTGVCCPREKYFRRLEQRPWPSSQLSCLGKAFLTLTLSPVSSVLETHVQVEGTGVVSSLPRGGPAIGPAGH